MSPRTRELRQRIVWRLFEARNRCVVGSITALTDKSLASADESNAAYRHFRRLAWELARQVHPTRKPRRKAVRRRRDTEKNDG